MPNQASNSSVTRLLIRRRMSIFLPVRWWSLHATLDAGCLSAGGPWPMRRVAGLITPVVLILLLLTPLAGQWLQRRLPGRGVQQRGSEHWRRAQGGPPVRRLRGAPAGGQGPRRARRAGA